MKYIAFYDLPEYASENRSAFPSAIGVVDYMLEVFSSFTDVEVISPARTLNKSGFYRGRTHILSDKVTLRLPPGFGTKTSLGRLAAVLFTQLWLFFLLFFGTKRGEQIVVYHSLSLIPVVSLIKKLKKLVLVGEIREIYSDINKVSPAQRQREHEYFTLPDKYVVPSELLNAAVNKANRPYVIAPGTYRAEPKRAEKFADGRIHIVYAGTLRREKRGADAAIQTARCVDGRYHVHILGYGSEERIAEIRKSIAEVSAVTEAKVAYDGLLSGEEFSAFLQSCHIGLSTQDPSGDFNSTSFPSKVLTYLANGLDVLSANIAAVKDSPVGEYIYYYEKQEPREIARAIMNIDTTHPSDKTALLGGLHETLKSELRGLIIGGSGGNTV